MEEYPLINKPWFINPGLTLYVFSTFCMAGELIADRQDYADFITKRLDIAIVHLQLTWETLSSSEKKTVTRYVEMPKNAQNHVITSGELT